MSTESAPAPVPAKSGRFKTIVAWVCGPIVLIELIATAAIMIWAVSVTHSAQSSKTYVSMGRMLVGGLDVNPKLENGEPVPDSFYGTCTELLMSGRIRNGAQLRLHSLHPDMAPHMVKIEAARMPGTRILILRATCEEPAYARAMLDALMDEFIATQKEMTGPTSEDKVIAIQDELVRLEKDLHHTEENQKAAKQSGASAEELDKLKSERERTERIYDKLVETMREMAHQPKVTDLISIIERASPAVLVIPRFSLSNLFK